MAIISRVDQLDVYSHPFTFLLHTALKDIGNAEFPADVPQILASDITVSHHGRAADDSEVFDLCKTRQDVVLNAVGEKRVLFFRTKILER